MNKFDKRLPRGLALGGTIVYPTFRYLERGSTASVLAADRYGTDLAVAGSGSAITVGNGGGFVYPAHKSLKFNDGKYFKDSGTSFADVTTQDIIIELISKTNATGGQQFIICKRHMGTGTGYQVYQEVNQRLIFFCADAASAHTNYVETAATSSGSWYHSMYMFNRDENSTNGMTCWLNGVRGSSANGFTIGSMTVAKSLTIGADTDGNTPSDNNISLCSMWIGANIIPSGADGVDQLERLAKQRTQLIRGL